jgi:hypothetical protein
VPVEDYNWILSGTGQACAVNQVQNKVKVGILVDFEMNSY